MSDSQPYLPPIHSRWEIDVIRAGASWLARARCIGLNFADGTLMEAVANPQWVDLGAVHGATEDDAAAAVAKIIEAAKIEVRRVR